MKRFLLYLLMISMIMLTCACGLKGNPSGAKPTYKPLDPSKLAQSQLKNYNYYITYDNIDKSLSDLFDYQLEMVKYYYGEPPFEGYEIVIDFNLYPKTEMPYTGMHTIVKLDERILPYIFTDMIEKDMTPFKEDYLSWKPYEEKYNFFGFGYIWRFSCLSPEELEELNLSPEGLAEILKSITITTIWDGGSETVALTNLAPMIFEFKEDDR
jgi:hypothetical protein